MPGCRSRLRSALAIACTLFTLSGCASRRAVELPSGDGTPFPDVAPSYADAVADCRHARTITATLGLSGRAGDQRLRGSVDAGFAAPGTEVTLVWGEDRPSSKVQVEDHVQVGIRATVMPAPLVESARTTYRSDQGLK